MSDGGARGTDRPLQGIWSSLSPSTRSSHRPPAVARRHRSQCPADPGTGGGGSAGGGDPTADRPVPSPARAGTPGPPGRPHAPGTGAGQRSQLGKAPARSPCGRQQRRSPGRQRKPQQSQACPRFRLVRRWEWTVSVRPALLSGVTSLPAREVEADTGPRPGQRGGGVEGEGGSRLRNPGKLI